jgi:hypothetical protein
MKTKENYPFIYFYADPNIVFVYRIKTKNFIAANELIESGQMEAYEINCIDEFESFNHYVRKALKESGSFFINMDDLNRMAEAINKHIQNHLGD